VDESGCWIARSSEDPPLPRPPSDRAGQRESGEDFFAVDESDCGNARSPEDPPRTRTPVWLIMVWANFMTPIGHIGGGLVVGCVVEKVLLKEPLTPATLGLIIFLSILPDLDSLPAYIFKKWRPGQKKLDHHNYFSHTPLFYILLSIFVGIGLGKELGLLFLLVTLTHLLLDSWATDDGIMWLWPIRKQKYSILPSNLHEGGIYGVRYYLRYIRNPGLLLPEIILLVGGVVSVMVWWK
jgi:hypothetical protein